MQVDWRSLLSSIRVPWIDKGKNVSRGNINIRCPFCIDDPSYHLSIAEMREAYFCYREPNRHSGRNFIRLLIALGHSRDEGQRLLNYYLQKAESAPQRLVAPTDFDKLGRKWNRFGPASSSLSHLAYLEKRGFSAPKTVCEQFDLRFAAEGTWVKRLLIPLKDAGKLIGWTGRSITPHIQPNYYSEMPDNLAPPYSPDGTKPQASHFLIVEGPLDALKVATATRRLPIKTAALNGKYLGASKLLKLRRLADTCDAVWVALDSDVPISSAYQIINTISSAVGTRKVNRLKIPSGYKDPAELSLEGINQWLAFASTPK